MRFTAYDLTLQSNIAFPELPAPRRRRADLTLRLDRRPRLAAEPPSWRVRWRVRRDRPWLLVGEAPGRRLLRFPRLADVDVDAGRRAVVCHARPKTPRATVRHLWLDQVLPLLLSDWGRLVLDASAVATPRGAVAFIGSGGAGKSTLAAGLGQLGWPILADDALVVRAGDGGRMLATPSYPGVRLWGDAAAELASRNRRRPPVAHYTDKRRVLPTDADVRHLGRARRLRRVYLVAPQRAARGAARLDALTPREALVTLVGHAFDRDVLADRFTRFVRLAEAVLVRRLTLPRAFALPLVARDAIRANLVS